MKQLASALLLVLISVPISGQGNKPKATPDKPLSNDDLLAMVAAGVSEGTVIAAIEHAPRESLDVQADALLKLKKAGVSQAVLDAVSRRVGQRSRPAISADEQEEAEAESGGSNGPRPCVVNYKEEGSFWKGRRVISFEDLPKASKATTFDRTVQAIAARGWQIVSSSKETGVISASKPVGGSRHNKTFPLNVVINDHSPGGVRIDAFIQVPPGVMLMTDAAREALCKVLEPAPE